MNSIQPSPRESRNWFYTLLVPVSVVFAVTAIAYAIIPTLEDRAVQAGTTPLPSTFRDALREDGWWWLLIQAAGVVTLSIAAMLRDAMRTKKSSEI